MKRVFGRIICFFKGCKRFRATMISPVKMECFTTCLRCGKKRIQRLDLTKAKSIEVYIDSIGGPN